MNTLIAQIIFGAAVLMPAALSAQTAYTEGLINIPGVAPQAYGIDANNQVVGYFYDSGNVRHGFVLSQGVVAQIDQPGQSATSAMGIDSQAGIVGYSSGAASLSGMLDSKRAFKTVKGGANRVVTGINASGTFVGTDETATKAYINVKGVYSAVNPPACQSLTKPVNVYVLGVNASNDLVGVCYAGDGTIQVGYARVGGVYQTVSVFGSTATTPAGINDSGTIAGSFVDNSGLSHGFLLTAGTATQFDFQDNPQTAIQGINNQDSLAGITLPAGASQWTGFYAFAN
jgi:hypothetical protein